MGKINDRKTVAGVLLAMLIISVFITVAPTVSATTIYTVHPTDPIADFTTIKDAIDNASAGDSIEVWNSTYHEHVTVNKQLNIYSRDGADVTIVDGGGSDKCFYVTANNVTISGFTVQNGAYGIYLYDSDNNIITENAVSFNKYEGISLDRYCDFNEIRDNTVNSNERHGINLGRYDGNNKIIGNTVDSNWQDGIQIGYDNNENEIANNTIEFNDRYGIHLGSYCEDNNLTQNNINNNLDYGIYIYYASNNLIYNNYLNNTKNAYDGGTNRWNITKTAGTNIIGGPYLGGNYWSDYVGNDTDGDGLGDTPYYIPGGSNKDYLPLVIVTIPGDIDGDGDVDFDDIVAVCMAYMSKPGDPNWNPNADIDRDGDVDFDDVVIAAMNYGKGT